MWQRLGAGGRAGKRGVLSGKSSDGSWLQASAVSGGLHGLVWDKRALGVSFPVVKLGERLTG